MRTSAAGGTFVWTGDQRLETALAATAQVLASLPRLLPLASGKSCYRCDGGLIGLCGPLDPVVANCTAGKEPVGTVSPHWVLSPKFWHPKKG